MEAFVSILPDLEFYNNITINFSGPAHQSRKMGFKPNCLFTAAWAGDFGLASGP